MMKTPLMKHPKSLWTSAITIIIITILVKKQGKCNCPTNRFMVLFVLGLGLLTHACRKISSSSRLRLSSTWRRPLSSASRIRRCLSANMANAWILRSSCSLISSLDKKSNIFARTLPSSRAKCFSIRDI